MQRILVSIILISTLSLFYCKNNTADDEMELLAYTGTGSVTKGIGTTTIKTLYSCAGGRATSVGTIHSADGKTWTVPAETNFGSAAVLADLYNECNGNTPSSLAQVDTASVPLKVIDEDGEIITGYIYGDNYYELYVNGTLVGVDAVPFTPFNSSFVKFKAKRPIQYALKVVDWEENLGIGTEANLGNAIYPGDGGFIASFSDGTVTGPNWKAQTFYIAPLADAGCVVESGNERLSSDCVDSPPTAAEAYALHWEVPSTWYGTSFDDTTWPAAHVFSEATVSPKVAFTRFADQFAGAQFIWSSNLILDNLVLLRYTAE
ncbi:hypothetical protein CLV98_10773 [Dyadobacter jejuensis]|uniref:Uncharacterized protein n=1 Tax=Dyadobacter jejuensis TaxID=1082580 RepID=A0A316AI27_9BACT|nr:hypothetical protein [Dyadobacter jejuensis]PWJ57366.1 hypothetical protein CLV98_10773 [Dyadobacter jejuensis]